MSIPNAEPAGSASSVPSHAGTQGSASSSIPNADKTAGTSIPSADPTKGRSIPSATPNVPKRRQRNKPDEPVDPQPTPDPKPPLPPPTGPIPEDLEDWLDIEPQVMKDLQEMRDETQEKIFLNFQIWLQTQDDIRSIRDELAGGESLIDKKQREGIEQKIEKFTKRFIKGGVTRSIAERIERMLTEKTESIGRKVAELFGKRPAQMARKFPKLFKRYRSATGKIGRASTFGLGLDIATQLISNATDSRIEAFHQFDDVFSNIPVVGSFYNATIQLGETFAHAFGVPSDQERREKVLKQRLDFLQRYSEDLEGDIAQASYWQQRRDTMEAVLKKSEKRFIALDRRDLIDAFHLVQTLNLNDDTDLSELRELASRYRDDKQSINRLQHRLFWLSHPSSFAAKRELRLRRQQRRQWITVDDL